MEEPEDGGNGARRMTRHELAVDLVRAHHKAGAKLQDARTLKDEIAQQEALVQATSAFGTISEYVPSIVKVLGQNSRAGAAKADADLHELIVKYARRMPKDAHLVSKVYDAIGGQLGKRQIRRVLVDARIIEVRSKK